MSSRGDAETHPRALLPAGRGQRASLPLTVQAMSMVRCAGHRLLSHGSVLALWWHLGEVTLPLSASVSPTVKWGEWHFPRHFEMGK